MVTSMVETATSSSTAIELAAGSNTLYIPGVCSKSTFIHTLRCSIIIIREYELYTRNSVHMKLPD